MYLRLHSVTFRAVIVRAVRSGKMSLAGTLVVLNRLHGPVGVDLVLHIV